MKTATTFETQSNLENVGNAIAPDSLDLLGIESTIKKSEITKADYVEWTGKPVTIKIANYKGTESIGFVTRPKAYYVPASYYEVIERLKLHGIKMEIIKQPREVTVEMYRIKDATFQDASGKVLPFEGHIQVTGMPVPEIHKQVFATGSAFISTDQPLGDLAVLLLEPNSPDSYFQWGFFHEIFQRTEYIEAYVMEPTMKKMLENSPELEREFEQKKTADPIFAKDPQAIFSWFYSKTKYYDERYLLYPVGREL
jgi:hypothetical protein